MDGAPLTAFIDDCNCAQQLHGGMAESRRAIDEFQRLCPWTQYHGSDINRFDDLLPRPAGPWTSLGI